MGGGGGEGGKVGGIPVESLSTLKAGAIVAPLPDGRLCLEGAEILLSRRGGGHLG